ncbi:MAG: formate dehydrogenase accessory protein FdhE [Anaerolineae bacterium]
MATLVPIQDILAQLEQEQERRPELAEAIALHQALLSAQAKVEVSAPSLERGVEEVKDLLRQGTPLLGAEELEIDWQTFAWLYERTCHIAARHQPELAEAFAGLQALPHDDPQSLKSLVADYLRNGQLEEAEGLGLPGDLLAFALNNALHPFLRAYAAHLTPLVDDSLWLYGRCPVCGGQPDFAFLDEQSGTRHLLCSRCDSQWLYRRLQCPFCDNTDHTKLFYYPSEDGVYRLYVCQVCNRYLKAIDLRKVDRKVVMPVERIITVAMDVAAREAGYK